MPRSARHRPANERNGLYIHIPFCVAKCAYCDFVSFPGQQAVHADYVQALCHELERRAVDWQTTEFDTLFYGGGTPTVLAADELLRILDTAQRHLHLATGLELTVEANPGTVNLEGLARLRSAGVNRLSLGVQSLRDAELALLGRIHCASEAITAFAWARQAGFDNINLDLILGLPEQRVADWQETLLQALALRPEHLSLYALTVEPGTPLAEWIDAGSVPAPDDNDTAEMYEQAEQLLAEAGYRHYEISNWALPRVGCESQRRGHLAACAVLPDVADEALLQQLEPGREEYMTYACCHNLKYWRNEPYLGLGVAATSYDGYVRRTNTPDLPLYLANAGEGPVSLDRADEAQRMGETLMLGLRLMAGVTWQGLARRLGVDVRAVYASQISALQEEGLLEVDALGLRLTRHGYLLGNRVFRAFLR